MTSVRDVWIVELGRVHARAGEGRAPCNAMQLRGTLPRVMEPPFCFVFNKDMTRVRARPAAGRYRGAESSTHSMSSSQPPAAARNMAATLRLDSAVRPARRANARPRLVRLRLRSEPPGRSRSLASTWPTTSGASRDPSSAAYSPSRGSPHTHPTPHPPASPVVPTAYP